MLLNEIARKVKMTKRAIKYYEEKQLLAVKKDRNGYRNYSEEDVETLKKISIYRKLGIKINDIRKLLNSDDKSILERIYQEKKVECQLKEDELKALRNFIDNDDLKVEELLDYQTINEAIESLIPGAWSEYFKSHFQPFLNVKIETLEQKQALERLLIYCDKTTIKIPWLMKLGFKLAKGIIKDNRSATELIAYYRDMDKESYDKLKQTVLKGAKLKSGILKYHPAYIAQRKMLKELQNKGYNDIFIPNLKQLSPLYREYKDALDKVNEQICQELGLYYDANYNLVLKDKTLGNK